MLSREAAPQHPRGPNPASEQKRGRDSPPPMSATLLLKLFKPAKVPSGPAGA